MTMMGTCFGVDFSFVLSGGRGLATWYTATSVHAVPTQCLVAPQAVMLCVLILVPRPNDSRGPC